MSNRTISESTKQDIILKTATQLYSFDNHFYQRIDKIKTERKYSPKEIASVAVISESYDFLQGCIRAYKDKNIRSAGTLLRCILESSANTHWFLTYKNDDSAKKYMQTINSLTEYMESLFNMMNSPGTRIPMKVTEWTTSKTEQRLKKFSPQALLIWDYCSLYTHAQPSLMAYNLTSPTNKSQLFIIGQAVIYSLTIRHLIEDNTKLFSENETRKLNEMTIAILPYM